MSGSRLLKVSRASSFLAFATKNDLVFFSCGGSFARNDLRGPTKVRPMEGFYVLVNLFDGEGREKS